MIEDDFDKIIEQSFDLTDLQACLGQWFLKHKKYLPINKVSKKAREEYIRLFF